jgi:hypothetical protein
VVAVVVVAAVVAVVVVVVAAVGEACLGIGHVLVAVSTASQARARASSVVNRSLEGQAVVAAAVAVEVDAVDAETLAGVGAVAAGRFAGVTAVDTRSQWVAEVEVA